MGVGEFLYFVSRIVISVGVALSKSNMVHRRNSLTEEIIWDILDVLSIRRVLRAITGRARSFSELAPLLIIVWKLCQVLHMVMVGICLDGYAK